MSAYYLSYLLMFITGSMSRSKHTHSATEVFLAKPLAPSPIWENHQHAVSSVYVGPGVPVHSLLRRFASIGESCWRKSYLGQQAGLPSLGFR
jgi:hypothetical protein